MQNIALNDFQPNQIEAINAGVGAKTAAAVLNIGQPWEGDVRLVLFVQLASGEVLDDERAAELRLAIRSGATPRHVPEKILSAQEIPYTRSGKKVEIAVREIISGFEPLNKEALANPEALDYFRNRDELST